VGALVPTVLEFQSSMLSRFFRSSELPSAQAEENTEGLGLPANLIQGKTDKKEEFAGR